MIRRPTTQLRQRRATVDCPPLDAPACAASPPVADQAVVCLPAPARTGWRLPRGRPTAWLLFLTMSLVATLVFVLSGSTVVMLAVELGVFAASTLVLGRGWWTSRRCPSTRDPLIGLAFLALLLYSLATAAFVGWPVARDVLLPVPSIVDALFFVSYVCFGIFLFKLGSRSKAHGRHQYLDTLIVALGVMPIIWVRLVEPQLLGWPISPMQLTFLAYPIFVSVLLGLTIRLAFRAHRLTVPYALLGGWIGLEVAADLVFVDTGLAGTYAYGQPWQAMWVLSAGCLGALALHPGAWNLLQARVDAPVGGRNRVYFLGSALTGPMIADEMGERSDGLVLVVGVVLTVAVCVRLSGLIVDVAEQRRDQAELRRLSDRLTHQASHDPLTGLANRVLLSERLDSRLTPYDAADTSVLLLDVDDFKLVNDSLGHAVGDLLLVEVAHRIQSELRAEDHGGRLGGDEFVVILDHSDAEQAQALADRLLDTLARPMMLGQTEVSVSVSIGIAASSQVQDGLNLLGAADMAMYVAKQRGKAGTAVFEPQMQQLADERLTLEIDLRRALRNDELFLAYQPIVDLKTGQLAGVEALVRWRHDTRGLVSPELFIPIAERTGLILPLGEWVLRESVAQLGRWEQQVEQTEMVVNVNVSTRQLERPGLLAAVDDLIADGLDPSRLVLEITETALTLDGDAASDTLQQLRARGVRLAVDDFGTGYSSLSRLQAAPVSQLKVDRSFVDEIETADSLVPIIHATVAMADGLHLGVIAEGIETPAQLRYLQHLGCAHAQGYLLAPPQDAQAITAMLTGPLPWTGLFAGATEPNPLAPVHSRTNLPSRRPAAPRLEAATRDLLPSEVIRAAEAIAAEAAAEVAADAAVTAQAAVDVAGAAAVEAADKAERVARDAADAAAEAAHAVAAAHADLPAQERWEVTRAVQTMQVCEGCTVEDADRDVAPSRAAEAAVAAARIVAARVQSVAAEAAEASARAADLIELRLAADAIVAACVVQAASRPGP